MVRPSKQVQGAKVWEPRNVENPSEECKWLPHSFKDLHQRVREEHKRLSHFSDKGCTCKNCHPEFYTPCKHHHAMKLHTIDTSMSRVPRDPVVEGVRLYSAMELAENCVAYFNRPRREMNRRQINAINRFHRYTKEWGNRLGWEDGPRAICRDRWLKLLNVFNDLCFFGVVNNLEFEWLDESENVLGHCIVDLTTGTPTIAISTRDWCNEFWEEMGSMCEARKRDRISTALHEMIHAYLERYACGDCPMWHKCIGFDGHGAAWQLIAAAIEKALPHLLDIPVALGRFIGVVVWVDCYRRLPSPHDLQHWDLTTNWVMRKNAAGKFVRELRGDSQYCESSVDDATDDESMDDEPNLSGASSNGASSDEHMEDFDSGDDAGGEGVTEDDTNEEDAPEDDTNEEDAPEDESSEDNKPSVTETSSSDTSSDEDTEDCDSENNESGEDATDHA